VANRLLVKSLLSLHRQGKSLVYFSFLPPEG
jgi:hypothetical protein